MPPRFPPATGSLCRRSTGTRPVRSPLFVMWRGGWQGLGEPSSGCEARVTQVDDGWRSGPAAPDRGRNMTCYDRRSRSPSGTPRVPSGGGTGLQPSFWSPARSEWRSTRTATLRLEHVMFQHVVGRGHEMSPGQRSPDSTCRSRFIFSPQHDRSPPSLRHQRLPARRLLLRRIDPWLEAGAPDHREVRVAREARIERRPFAQAERRTAAGLDDAGVLARAAQPGRRRHGVAERVGFEPTKSFDSALFKSAAINRSATSPPDRIAATSYAGTRNQKIAPPPGRSR